MLVPIPGGQAEIREKPTVYGREILQQAGFDVMANLKRAMPDKEIATLADLTSLPLDSLDAELVASTHQLQRAAVVALLKSWSFPDALPTMDSVGTMDIDLYDALSRAVAPLVGKAMLGENFGPSGATDPSSPTVPSPASPDGGRGPMATSIPEPAASGESFATDGSSV